MIDELTDIQLLTIALDENIFRDDWEFETIFGAERSKLLLYFNDLRDGKRAALPSNLVSTIKANILDYPHGSEIYLRTRYGVELA